MSYSQNNEEAVVNNWFGDYIGSLLSIGENNGIHLSNAFALIKAGWSAALIEPSMKVFPQLYELHKGNEKVYCYPIGIGATNSHETFYDSGELLGNGDKALVSTFKKEETRRWESINMAFDEVEIEMQTFEMFLSKCPYKKFDFISIDAEGLDIDILNQIDLAEVGCKCLCIEHNSVLSVVQEIREYCAFFGLNKEIGYNQENIILVHE